MKAGRASCAGLPSPTAASSSSRALLWSAAALAIGALSLVALHASRHTSAALAERLLGGQPAAAAAAAASRPPATAAADRPLLPRPPRVFEDPPKGQDDSYVALCIAVKDEHCDIREWVLHHASLGVRRMYVFDTQSQPPMRDVLDDLIASGLVAYQHLADPAELDLPPPTPGRSYNWQRPLYARCLERYGARHRWMGFIDADEFIVLTGGEQGGGGGGSSSSSDGGSSSSRSDDDGSGSSSSSDAGGSGSSSGSSSGSDAGGSAGSAGDLPALLRGYERYGGLALHWRQFGFSGHVERPRGGVLASYTSCSPRDAGPNRHVKSLVQPRFTIGPQTVHSFRYKGARGAVNTAGVPVPGPKLARPGQKVSYRGAVLHHYISRSLADFEVKQARRAGDGSVKTLAHFLEWARQATATCSAAVPLGRALAARYDLQRNVPQRCLQWAEA